MIIEEKDLKPNELPINKIIHGDALATLKKLPSNSIDCVITSPPYYAQRVYKGVKSTFGGDPRCEHEWVSIEIWQDNLRYRAGRNTKVGADKNPQIYGDPNVEWLICKKCGAQHGQLGLEPDPFMYIKHLIEIFKEVKRVLKPHGNLFVVIDDTFSGSNKGFKSVDPKYPKAKDGCLDPRMFRRVAPRKSFMLVPEMFAIEMVYELGFILRQKIIWSKKTLIYNKMETFGNAMPESMVDRQVHTYEYIYHFVKEPKYYYDQLRVPYTKPLNRWGGEILKPKPQSESEWDKGTGQNTYRLRNMRPNPMGAIAPDVITINTEPFPDAHFAVFPERLVEFLIKVGCPEQVCRMCGKPYKKEYEKIDISNLVDWRYYGANEKGEYHGQAIKDCESAEAQNPSDVKRRILQGLRKGVVFKEYKPTCNCNASTEGGIVLDPFLGSGTTALVALKMGRRFIGIEINRSYCEMALKRIEPYLKQATLESFVRW